MNITAELIKPSMLCFPFTALGEKGTEEMGLAPKTTKQRFPYLTIQQFNE